MESALQLKPIYGSKVFREAVIRMRLNKKIYQSYLKTIESGSSLDNSIAPDVAKAMMEWAIENGATHYAHWFLPMTDVTACKHDSFFTPTAIGEATLDFPPSTLVKGEPDASSFPSGGLRATFEARGYTTWDPTSPAFVRDGTLFIPSVFVSYNGEALDRKLPLLKSIEALNREGLRFIKFFKGQEDVRRITASVGSEQEYFLIDRKHFEERLDLKMCGRTLLGARPPKAQKLDDHYMARIKIRVSEFMKQVDRELWELGIPAKTKHNEVAPSQHELAPVYENANIAADHNQMTMELMRTIAKKQGLALLLHEKPFAGVNGSGKHNNYSIGTDTGVNLLQPREWQDDDGLFLLVLCAFLRAVDKYGDLIRMAAASHSNDQRLGGFEAPPSIVSVFLGEGITNQLLSAMNADYGLPKKEKGKMSLLPSIPDLSVDDSDRNRTSPMAFTGNKFEFRMLGSSQSIAVVNTILNSALAESLSYFATRFEKALDVGAEKQKLIEETITKHGRIIFNGNNYSSEWIEEAKKRGLPIINNTVDAIEALRDRKNIELFEKMKVYSEAECLARYEVRVENYIQSVSIEAETLLHMIKRQILPVLISYTGKVADSFIKLKKAGFVNNTIQGNLAKLNLAIEEISNEAAKLEALLAEVASSPNNKEKAVFMYKQIIPEMISIRSKTDAVEEIVGAEDWPIPTYTQILYTV